MYKVTQAATDPFVIIRSAGERTAVRCYEAIAKQGFSDSKVGVVRETPFSRALHVSFEMGMDEQRPWTFFVDADVIVREGAIASLARAAEGMPKTCFAFQGYMLDKFTATIRDGAIHCYRTEFLNVARHLIPFEGESLRPESEVKRRMANKGYTLHVVPYVVGIHDFGQYNRDIFRKCFTHAHKHLHLLPDLIALARSRSNSDPDFSVALHGYAEGVRAAERVRIDVRHRAFADRFADLDLPEKRDDCDLTAASAECILNDWARAEDIRVRGLPVSALKAVKLGGDARFSRWGRFVALYRRERAVRGILPLMPHALGTALEIAGRRLKNFALPRVPNKNE